jgi:hypothetical protein
MVASLALAGLPGLLLVDLASSQAQTCPPVDQSAEEILPRVVLTWDSSFRCAGAPDQGAYEITVVLSSSAASAAAIRLERLELTHTTPRPRGEAPAATAQAAGLPATLAPGASVSLTINGQYDLVSTDDGEKANLHLLAHGQGLAGGEPFSLGINVHLRGWGGLEQRGNVPNASRPAGPPEWAPGPPPWAAERAARSSQGDAAGWPQGRLGPPLWAGGPPPWVRNR